MDREELLEKLGEKMQKGYEDMMQEMLSENDPQLVIDNAGMIVAANLILENYRYCSDYVLENLLTLKNPLYALADTWHDVAGFYVEEMLDGLDQNFDRDWLTSYEQEDESSGMQME